MDNQEQLHTDLPDLTEISLVELLDPDPELAAELDRATAWLLRRQPGGPDGWCGPDTCAW